jgi:hypothetical protein
MIKTYRESLVIGLDFDGTCTTHAYPNIGGDIVALPVLRKIVDNGHKLMLWTMRGTVLTSAKRNTLEEALKWFSDNEIPLWGINENPLQKETGWSNSNKQHADLFIDDAALGCPLKYDATLSGRPFVNWVVVEQMLTLNKII